MGFDLEPEGTAVLAEVADLVDTYGLAEIRALRAEVRELNAERHAESFHRELAKRNLIALGLEQPWGRASGPTERYALHEALDAAGMPTYSLEISESFAGMILRHGPPALVDEHLPRLLSGEWTYAGGYSEPEAGSDLLALRTRAVRDGDGPDADFVVTGSKLWTSSAHLADWIVTIVRTDPEGQRHRGLSVLVIDAHAPGVTIDAVPVIGGWRVNAVSFDEVRVPAGSLLGEENRGWAVITAALNDERSMSFGGHESRLLLGRLIHRWASAAEPVDDVRAEQLGELVVELEIDRLLNLRVPALAERGEDAAAAAAASISKVSGSELAQRTAEWVEGALVGEPGDPLVVDAAQALRTSTAFTIIGGTSEVQRNVIADHGLGLPR
jgi:alkylation response protein AidB-like acyl-CoA dehydrogenase